MTAAISLAVLLLVLGSSIAVAAGMLLTGLVLNQVYSPMPLTRMMGELAWSTTSNFILTAIPFYIMFGEILLRSGIAERMYNAMVQWLSWLPGGLMHSNIGSCALFGSVSGSSGRRARTCASVRMGSWTIGPTPSAISRSIPMGSSGTMMSLNRIAASTPKRRTG